MPNEMIDIMTSLSAIMNEETRRLQGQERALSLAELAAAKARLVARLEELLARRNRHQPEWAEEMEVEIRERLIEALAELRHASATNASLLERQIDLSMEMMTAIAAEARRLAGNRARTYGARGDLAKMELTTPISFNGEY
ncbi:MULTISPECIES: flagellar biosynthesis protein FlgN [unclassified Sphingobium]|uniref:flagellar biosynthesis protein FlgN n=1 Tax=unclassified Sphingobium TaxID=2611147 RepID=UPI0007F32A25|nr:MULTISPECIES: flagellar biosynthesis protein FlgN [unclassified Sphingobium]OAN52566.1 flagellar biosynthesis protein FlgN [Sphingobium sp. TCM1]WIW90885.1 flagellar biosynthesis protein FlgN [Sphingobium sp. V4]